MSLVWIWGLKSDAAHEIIKRSTAMAETASGLSELKLEYGSDEWSDVGGARQIKTRPMPPSHNIPAHFKNARNIRRLGTLYNNHHGAP